MILIQRGDVFQTGTDWSPWDSWGIDDIWRDELRLIANFKSDQDAEYHRSRAAGSFLSFQVSVYLAAVPLTHVPSYAFND